MFVSGSLLASRIEIRRKFVLRGTYFDIRSTDIAGNPQFGVKVTVSIRVEIRRILLTKKNTIWY